MTMYGELLKELMESKKKFYVADSIDASETIGYDPEQLSQVIAESVELSHNLFEEMCEVVVEHEDIHNPEYGYNEDEDLAWVYDSDSTTHYFYR